MHVQQCNLKVKLNKRFHKTKVENEIKVFLQTNLLDMSLREIVHQLTLSRYRHKWTGTWTPKLRVQRRISINFVNKNKHK